jgi:hypothetical protein
MVHGWSTSSWRSYGISNGTMNCTQWFSCSYWNTSTSGWESCSPSCNSGYYASGWSCLPYTYTLSYGWWWACSASPTWSWWWACSVSCWWWVQYRTCSNTTGTQTRTATCTRDQDGASVSLANCGSVSTSQSCSSSCIWSNSQSCNTGACYTYSWSTGSWGSCSASPTWSWWSACSWWTQSRTCSNTSGSQTRTVECLRSDWVVVADGNCSWGKPSTSQSCTSSCSGSSTQSCTPMWTWWPSVLVETSIEDAGPCLGWFWSSKSWSCPLWDMNWYTVVPSCKCPDTTNWAYVCYSTLERYEQYCN